MPTDKTTLSYMTSLLGQDENVDRLLNSLNPDYGYGRREDGSHKGKGFLGEIPNKNGGVSTELSIGVNILGQDRQIPLIVPTMSQDDLSVLMSLKPKDRIPENLIDKAVQHAVSRIRNKQSPFAGFGEDR